MKKIFLILLISLFTVNAYATEVLEGEDYKEDSVTLNEKLRKIEKDIATSDDQDKTLSGDVSFSGAVTFSDFPITPSAAPDADYEVANKKYVDDSVVTVPGRKTGAYTGDGNATQAITGVGFQPKFLIIYSKGNANINGPFMKSDQDTTYTHYDQGSAHYYNEDYIISLDADGFTLGDGTGGGTVYHCNYNTYDYTYIAFE